ncbi:MAG: NAD-dependent deacylase [Phycisphaeraceae bacterium]|nr:NAD-dependent deacylase [Phycisphaeraceae bacterium]
MSDSPDDAITRAAEQIAEADHLCVMTGAGASAESGIPTFRDALDGLWSKYDPTDLATPEAFNRDPATVSRWYEHRRQLCLGCEPNPGHHALAELQRAFLEADRQFTLITQNVDGLHQRAGSQDPIQLHGSLFQWRCIACEQRHEPGDQEPETFPPPCPACEQPLRPSVVWFGEALPPEALAAAGDAAEGCDVFLSIGTSSQVQPAASLAWTAVHGGATLIEINPDPTPVTSRADAAISLPFTTAMDRLLSELSEIG